MRKNWLINIRRIALVSVLLLTPLLIGGGVYVARSNTHEEPLGPDAHWLELQKKIDRQIRHFPGTAGILVKDLKRGWVIAHNADSLFPSASLVKIPLMAGLYHANSAGRISLDEVLPLQKRFKVGGSGKLRFKKSGTRFTLRQLIYKMITESDNTAANMLTDLFGLDYYNAYFLKLGLGKTNFVRMVMDLKKRDQGIENYTTPRDMALLLEMIHDQKLTGSEEMLEILKSQKINDRLARAIPSGWQIGHKTGLMRDSCHDVGIVFAPTGNYLICTLTSNIRSFRKAKGFISQVSHLTALYYNDPSLHPPVIVKRSFWSRIWSKERSG